MCLSTIYKNEYNEKSLFLRNIAKIEFVDGYIELTDLMERKTKVKGTIVLADLLENYVVLQVED